MIDEDQLQQDLETLDRFYAAVAEALHQFPPSREMSLALTNLQQSSMWATAALTNG